MNQPGYVLLEDGTRFDGELCGADGHAGTGVPAISAPGRHENCTVLICRARRPRAVLVAIAWRPVIVASVDERSARLLHMPLPELLRQHRPGRAH